MQTPCAVAARAVSGSDSALAEAVGAAGYMLAAQAGSVPEALHLVRELRPELLLADLALPGGDGVELIRQVQAMPLNVYPDALLMAPEGLMPPDPSEIAALGAGMLRSPVTSRDILSGLATLDRDRLPPRRAERLQALLDRLGLPDHPGREMLAQAAALAWRDRRRLSNLRDRIYPDAGRPFGRSGAQAERAIRHAIDVAWRTGEMEQQHQIFGNTIDARRGRPTGGEMIAQLADILRWEG